MRKVDIKPIRTNVLTKLQTNQQTEIETTDDQQEKSDEEISWCKVLEEIKRQKLHKLAVNSFIHSFIQDCQDYFQLQTKKEVDCSLCKSFISETPRNYNAEELEEVVALNNWKPVKCLDASTQATVEGFS